MWYKKAQDSILDLSQTEKNVANMHPYDTNRHMDLIHNLHRPNKPSFSASIEDKINAIHDFGLPYRAYLERHPQIYVYPSDVGTWKYIIYDPTNLKAVDKPDYFEDIDTNFSVNDIISPDEIIQKIHKQYPTALIDYFDTEAEAKRDE